MAATINVGSSTDPISVADGDVVTGTAMGKRLHIAQGAKVTFRSLILAGDVYPAATVNNTNSGTQATNTATVITLEGINLLTGGIGGAGLRVPSNAVVEINGPGTLLAQGGQWRALIGTDAGAGIGGGNTSNISASADGNRGDGCGKVTINSGTINAYGGASGNTDVGNGSALANYTYAAGIGGSGRAGAGCNLTINGGNVTAGGGRVKNNDIGPGLGYGNSSFDTEAQGTVGKTVINGGSVNANIYTNAPAAPAMSYSAIQISAGATTTVNGVTFTCNETNCGTGITNNTAINAIVTPSSNGVTTYCRKCNRTNNGNTCTFRDPDGNTSTTTTNDAAGRTSCIFFDNRYSTAQTATNTNSVTIGGQLFTCNATDCPTATTGSNTTTSVNAANIVTKNGVTVVCGRCNRTATGNNQSYCIFTDPNGQHSTGSLGNSNAGRTSCAFFADHQNYNPELGVPKNNAGTQVFKYQFIHGFDYNEEAADVAVRSCKFGDGLTCDSTRVGTDLYGIKDVKTDFERNLYFWVPSYNGARGDTMSLYIDGVLKNYTGDYEQGLIYTLHGGLPSMSYPIPTPGSLTCSEEDIGKNMPPFVGSPENRNCTAAGAYRTNFNMVGSQYVAAVGHAITMNKGTYIQNDANKEGGADANERYHSVRWCRSNSETQFTINPDTKVRTSNCHHITRAENTSVTAIGSQGPLTSADERDYNTLSADKKSITYTPNELDYGQYIWAEVVVRDNSNRPTYTADKHAEADWDNAVQYPPIKIGVVITTHITAGEGFIYDQPGNPYNWSAGMTLSGLSVDKLEALNALPNDAEPNQNKSEAKSKYLFNNYTSAYFMQGGAAPRDNLVTNINDYMPLIFSGNALNPVDGRPLKSVTYAWSAHLKSAEGVCKGAIVDNWTKETDEDGNTKEIRNNTSSTGSIDFTMPNPVLPTVNFRNDISDDIEMCLEIRDGARPTLIKISVCRDEACADVKYTQSYDNEGNPTTSSSENFIPKDGYVKLEFDTEIVTKGIVTLKSNDDPNAVFGAGQSFDGKTIVYHYEKSKAGGWYDLDVDGFKNFIGNNMNTVKSITLKIEQKPVISISNDDATPYFVVGQASRTGDIEVDPKQGNVVNGECYWQIVTEEQRTAVLTAEATAATEAAQNGDYFVRGYEATPIGTKRTCLVTFTAGLLSPPYAAFSPIVGDFGSYARLVIRTIGDGTKNVEGDQYGEVNVSEFKPIGILLAPGTTERECERDGTGTLIDAQDGVCDGNTTIVNQPALGNNIWFNNCSVDPGLASNTDTSVPRCAKFTTEDGTDLLGYVVYNDNLVRLQIDISNVKYVIKTWVDDKTNTCIFAENDDAPIQCAELGKNQVFYKPLATNATDGIITINPRLGLIDNPKMSYAGIKVYKATDLIAGTTTEMDLVTEYQSTVENTAVLNNELLIRFGSYSMMPGFGDIILSRNGVQVYLMQGGVIDPKKDDITNPNGKPDGLDEIWQGLANDLVVPIDFGSSAFNTSGSANFSIFDASYTIRLQNFKSMAGETMDPEPFTIHTAIGPSFTNKPDLEQVRDPEDGLGGTVYKSSTPNQEFVIGEEITFNLTSLNAGYEVNGGCLTHNDNYDYCWQRAETQLGTSPDCTPGMPATATYTPNGDDFNQYIRLVVTPKDNGACTTPPKVNSGVKVGSEWVHVGVLLKMAAIERDFEVGAGDLIGNPVYGLIGSLGSSVLLPSMVVSRWEQDIDIVTTGSTTDELVAPGWKPTEGTVTLREGEKFKAVWTPEPMPTGTVTLSAKVKDGSTPIVTADFIQPDGESDCDICYFTISIKNAKSELKKATFTNNGARLVISKGTEKWYYPIRVNDLTDMTSSFNVDLSAFENDLHQKIALSGFYEISIEAGAFEDRNGNVTGAASLLSFGHGEYFAVRPEPYSITATKEYGTPFDNATFTVENISNAAAAITVTPEIHNTEDFDVTCTTVGITKGQKATCTVSQTATKLNAATYEFYVSITIDGKPLNEQSTQPVLFTYIVSKKKLLAPVNSSGQPAQFATGTKVYDGTKTAPDLAAWTWGGTGVFSGDAVDVEPEPGVFGDEGASGGAKSVTIMYYLKGNDAGNYVFEQSNDNWYRADLTAYITAKPITIKLTKDIEKDYDGLSTFTHVTKEYYEIGNAVCYDNEDDYCPSSGCPPLVKIGNEFCEDVQIFTGAFGHASTEASANQNFTASGISLQIGDNVPSPGNDYTPASNYSFNDADLNKNDKTVTVNPVSLAGLLQNGGYKGINSATPAVRTTYFVTADAIYGDVLSDIRNMSKSDGRPELYEYMNPITGDWIICSGSPKDGSGNLTEPEECNDKIASGIGLPENEADNVYAWFRPTGFVFDNEYSANYKSDLVVPVELTVARKQITIIASKGSKTYDGNEILNPEDVHASGNTIGLVNDVDKAKFTSVQAKSAVFDSEKALYQGLTITWALDADTDDSKWIAARYSANKTETMGEIYKRRVSITGLHVNDKDYDGTPCLKEATGLGTTLSPCVGGTISSPVAPKKIDLEHAVYKDSKLADDRGIIAQDIPKVEVTGTVSCAGACVAQFQYANVNWDGEKVDSVPVTFRNVTGLTNVITDVGGGTDVSDNYDVESLSAKAIINQIDLTAPTGLKEKVTYGQKVGETYIQLSSIGASPTGTQFPRQLNGIVSPIDGTQSKVTGTWFWEDEAAVVTQNATALAGDRTCTDYTDGTTDEYTYRLPVRFEGLNPNYKALTGIEAHICILPRRIEVEAPNGFATKIYDGTRAYDIVNHPILVGDPKEGSILDGDVVTTIVRSATFDTENVALDGRGMVQATKDLVIVYDIEAADVDTKNNYLPPVTYTQKYMTIEQRPVTLAVNVSNKYYDGSEDAVVSYESDLIAIAGNDESGVVPADNGRVTLKETSPKFYFNTIPSGTGNAGENLDLYQNGGLTLEGPVGNDKSGNYKLSFAALRGTIYPASLANMMCPKLSGTCATMTKAQKDSLLAADFELGTESVVVKELIKLKYDNWDEDKYGEKPETMPTLLSAYYGTYGSFTSKLDTLLPNTFGILFGGASELQNYSGLWSWANSTDMAQVSDNVQIGYANLIHSNRNYETLENIPIPLKVGKYKLRYSAAGVTRAYIEGKDTVTLVITPLNNANDIQISGWGTMDSPDAGENKSVIRIDHLDFSGDSRVIADNYDTTNWLNSLEGDVFATIRRAEYKLAPSVRENSFTMVYDTLSLNSRSCLSLSTETCKTLMDGWEWAGNEGARVLTPSSWTIGIVYAKHDTLNYLPAHSTVAINILPRSLDNRLDIAYVNRDKGHEVCDADSLILTVRAQDENAAIWYNDGYSSTHQGTYEAEFKVTGLNFGLNNIPFEIEAQDYDVEPRRIEYTHDYVRHLPFPMVATLIREKVLTISLDSTDNIPARKAFFDELNASGNKIDPSRTLWFYEGDTVGVGWSYTLPPAHAKDEVEMAKYSLMLVTTQGDMFNSCRVNGAPPPEEVVPIRGAKAGAVKLIASSYGTRMVRGGTNLMLDTPFGGTISVYSLKGELVTKMTAVETRTRVSVPATPNMYIVKFEAK